MIEFMKKERIVKKYFFPGLLVALAVSLIAIYVDAFHHIHQQMDESSGVILLIPIILIAWALGARGGMLAGLFVASITFYLHRFSISYASLGFALSILGGLVAVLIGWVTGRLSELKKSSLMFGADLTTDADGHEVAELVRKKTKDVLGRERNLLRTLIDNLPDKVYIKDEKSKYVINNIVHLRSIGLSQQEDALGKTSFDFFPEQLAKQYIADEQKIVETGEPLINHEEEVQDAKTGKINWHLTTKVPIRDIHGKIIGIVGLSRDITEQRLSEIARKRAEEAMRQSEERFRAVVEQSADAIYITDPETLQIVDSNQAFQKMLGYASAEVQQLPLEKFIIGPRDEIQNRIRTIVEHHESMSYDRQYQRKDGSIVDVVVSANTVAFGGKQLVCSFARDITEWKLLQDERERLVSNLRDSEQKFRTLFENLTEGVALHEMIYDENGKAIDYRILDINPSYEKHTGLLHKKAIGLLASVLYGTETPPYFEEYERVAHTGEPHIFETYFTPLERHFRIGVISPKQGTFATVFEDITDRKQKEKELQDKNAELERFTYTVSHDLKSPLITIKGFAGALLHDVTAGRHQRLENDLRRIADAADKMGGLLGNLLELSRVGRILNPPSDVNFVELAEEVVGLLTGTIAEHKVTVVVQPDLPVVFGDQRRLAEVLQNLIENAVKFMGDQQNPRIEIGTRKDGETNVLYVRDNGIGIDPRYHETVFGLFNKLDTGTQGTGIGLALVRRIIEIHGGKVWVESQGKGFGTTFCFTLSSNHLTRKDPPQ
jgi:PAS domain S-box-containing protein